MQFNNFVNSCNDKENLDCDFFIDDSSSLAQKLNELQKPCLSYEQKWNKHLR